MEGMTTTGSAALSDYSSRSVIINVTGMANQAISKVSNYQVKVPFSQMSQTIHNISLQGGRVSNVVVVESKTSVVTKPIAIGKVAKPAEVNRTAKSVVSNTKTSANNKASTKKNTASRSTNRKARRSKKTS